MPVIELTANVKYVAYDYVDVILTSTNQKATNLIMYFDFYPDRKSNRYHDGKKPGIEHSMRRLYWMKPGEYEYRDQYYLVFSDANDEKNIL